MGKNEDISSEESVLEVINLVKHYEKFSLKEVNFSVRKGRIMGFIGRNGAGKTTTLKSLLNMVHPDGGEIRFFGQNFIDHELEIKRKIGYVGGMADYYPTKSLKTIIEVTKRFYPDWNEEVCTKLMDLFKLDPSKKIKELSAGMKVKFSLLLAMSHGAKLLILDEPTSGLDPVSRDSLLDVFLELVKYSGVSILFSTHITSDLEKCADDITYIKNGEILACVGLQDFIKEYADQVEEATLESIMVHLEKENISMESVFMDEKGEVR